MAQSAELPTGEEVLHGNPPVFDRSQANQLTIHQDAARTVIRWDTFDIGQGNKVQFNQPDAGATLNIVSETVPSTIAGELSATGSVYLVNPRGITITSTGEIKTGGAFVASTLGLDDDNIQAFVNGGNILRFEVQPDDPQSPVINQGKITARDVLLLGSRVVNDVGATITAGDTVSARFGRVALGSASAATLDLTGDGFLQVLAPSELALPESDDVDPLVVNSGEIVAEGGLVQLKAATVREAIREAIHMPGEVQARSVTGREGKIVFSGGEGGTVSISGTVDASPEPGQAGAGGGQIEIDGSKVDLDFSKVSLGEGGRFALASDEIEITYLGNHSRGDATWITEDPWGGRSDIGDLLRAGVDVRLHGYKSVEWDGAFFIHANEVTAGSGKAGDVHLLAGVSITLSGTFQTYNSNWTLSVNVKPVSDIDLEYDQAYINMVSGPSGFARFINSNGHLTLEILGGDDSAGLLADTIDLPEFFRGEALTARIDPAAPAHDQESYIFIRGDVEVSGEIRLSGSLRTVTQTAPIATLKGASVIWETETEDLLMGSWLRFIEVRDGREVMTRFGRGGTYGALGVAADATRLILGSNGTAAKRKYGDENPGQADLSDLVLSLAPHNKRLPGEGARVDGDELIVPEGGIPLSQILEDGVIIVSGPPATAVISDLAGEQYYLTLTLSIDPDDPRLTFKELEYEELTYNEFGWVTAYEWLGGAAGSFWIDVTGPDRDGDGKGDGATIPLIIEPRPLHVQWLNPTYVYGKPEPLLKLDGLVNNDDIKPVGTLTISGGTPENITFRTVGDGFGISEQKERGEYTYTVAGITGERAGNYELVVDAGESGTLTISPRPLTYTITSLDRVYGSLDLPAVVFDDVASWHNAFDVVPEIRLYVNDVNGTEMANDKRLPVGTYTADVVGLTGSAAHNYELVPGGTATLTVTKRELRWQVAPVPDAEYGTKATVGAVTFLDLVEGDELGLEAVVAVISGSSPDQQEITLEARTLPGTYTMVVKSIRGSAAGNYILADAGNTPGTLVIHPKRLSLKPDTIYLTYGDTTGGRQPRDVPLPELVGVLEGDDVHLNPGNFRAREKRDLRNYPMGVDFPVGEYAVEPALGVAWDPLTGDHSDRYVLLIEDALPVDLVVVPKTIYYRVSVNPIEYGDFPVAQVTFDGVVIKDGFSDWVAASGIVIRRGNTSYPWSNTLDVGEYTVEVQSLTGSAAANYRLATTGNTPGKLVVEPRTLNPTFNEVVRGVYGDDLTFDVPFVDGLKMRIGAKLEGGQIVLRPGAGYHTAIVAELIGDDAYRYRLPDVGDRNTGVLEIAKRPVVVELLDFNRRYGDPVWPIPMVIDNLVTGDARPSGFTFEVTAAGKPAQFLVDRTPVGTYTIRVTRLDDPNYTLAKTGHTAATVTILPRPVRYKTYDVTVEYGQDGTFLGWADLFEEDILSGDQVWAGPMVVQFRDQYPLYLEAGSQYPLVPGGLEGIHAGNYVLQDAGSVRGLLTVTPRQLAFGTNRLLYNGQPVGRFRFSFGDFEMDYGLVGDRQDAFTVDIDEWTGLLPDDDVEYVIQRPELRFSSQGYLAAGTYVWTITLGGSSARNYQLPATGLSLGLEIVPRVVRSVSFETETLTYGDSISLDVFRPVFDFDGENDAFFAGADFELAPLVIRGPGDFEILVDDLWQLGSVRAPQAGSYRIWLVDDQAHPFRGPDAANFRYASPTTITGTIQVNPRLVTLSPPAKAEFQYGSEPQWRELYGEIVPADPSLLGAILKGDDVQLEFVEGWLLDENGEKVDGGRMQWWLSRVQVGSQWIETWVLAPGTTPGTYGQFQFRLVGPHAVNYELIQPTHTIQIVPKLVNPFQTIEYRGSQYYASHTYGDALRVSQDDLVFPYSEDCCMVAYRDSEGNLIPVSKLKVGSYAIDRLELVGADAFKYAIDLTVPGSGDARIAHLHIGPRELLYDIADVAGQYGNFLPCDDPRTCNGGYRPGYANVWTPGLTTGQVTLHNVIDGDDVQPGEVLLIDVKGRTGRLEDVPPPGIYFQVLASLTGEDAQNYFIATTGNKPGIMEISRLWVQWKTYDALYAPEWGFVSHHPGFDTWAHGLGADIMVGDQKINAKPKLALFWFSPELQWAWPEYWVRVEQWAVSRYPGMYWIIVDGFVGEDDNYFIPFPWDFDSMGILTAFADSTLGLDFVERIGNPFGYVPSVNQLQQQELREQAQQAGDSPVSEVAAFARYRAGANATFQRTNGIWKLGENIDYEAALSSDATGRAYAGALAKYGVTGVHLEAGAGVEVVFDVGAGYVRVGVDTGGMARADIGRTGISATAQASVGASAGGGVEGDIGGGVSGSVAGEVGALAQARAKVAYGFKDGKLQLGQELKAGAGLQAGTSFGIDTGELAVDAGVTVYSPGVFATDVSFGFGVDDGRLVFGVRGGLSLGFGGLSISLVIGIDLNALRDFLEDVEEVVSNSIRGLGCELGLGGCDPSPEEIGREQLRQAMQIEDPLLRAAFLQANAEWRLVGRNSGSPELTRAYDQSVSLLNTLDRLENNVERYVDLQRTIQEDFLYAVQHDPASAVRAAQEIVFRQYYQAGPAANLNRSIQEDLDALGLRLVASGGTVTFKWVGGR